MRLDKIPNSEFDLDKFLDIIKNANIWTILTLILFISGTLGYFTFLQTNNIILTVITFILTIFVEFYVTYRILERAYPIVRSWVESEYIQMLIENLQKEKDRILKENEELKRKLDELDSILKDKDKIINYYEKIVSINKFIYDFFDFLEKKGIFSRKELEKVLIQQRHRLLILYSWGEGSYKREWKKKLFGSKSESIFSKFVREVLSKKTIITLKLGYSLYMFLILDKNLEEFVDSAIRQEFYYYLDNIFSNKIEKSLKAKYKDTKKIADLWDDYNKWLNYVKNKNLPVLISFSTFISNLKDAFFRINMVKEAVEQLKKGYRQKSLGLVFGSLDINEFMNNYLENLLKTSIPLLRIKLIYIYEIVTNKEFDRETEEKLENVIKENLLYLSNKKYSNCNSFLDYLSKEGFENDYIKIISEVVDEDLDQTIKENMKRTIKALKEFLNITIK